jgi:hypothetical protein
MIFNFIFLVENMSPLQGLKTVFASFSKNILLRWSKIGSYRSQMFLDKIGLDDKNPHRGDMLLFYNILQLKLIAFNP